MYVPGVRGVGGLLNMTMYHNDIYFQTVIVSLRTMFDCGRMVGRSDTTRTSLVFPAMMMSLFVALQSSTLVVCVGCWVTITRYLFMKTSRRVL